ncbi:response regulator [Psychrosphaera haliotis]|uniref:Response regulator n=1 Tax=Psychrosphaera haliotis TaxID=555083 RepID=A0A6N8F6Q2_9GAMM|nr:response regulator [Psychrosphaera haliotis]MUH71069.1 response regulator [Psychrosphaera haliotis]
MSKNILVIDDADDILALFKELLSDLGLSSVTCISTGGAAIDLLKAQPFDLVILDIELPDINGKKVLDRINVENINVPVVMCSSYNSVDNVQLTWEMGAKGFLSKPIDQVKLQNLLQRIGIL